MRLVSCDSCGVFLDVGKLHFPPVSKMFGDDGCIDEALACYVQEISDYRPKVDCPVCRACIPQPV